MLTRHKKKIADILQKNRLRTDYGDVGWLADTMERFGLLEPVVLDTEGRLIAGGRRITAAQLLGWEEIDYVDQDVMSEADLHEMELIENCCREDMAWQEIALGVLHIHGLRLRDAALNPDAPKWTMEMTGAMLGKSRQRVQQLLPIAKYIKDRPESPAAKAPSLEAAVRMIAEELEQETKKLNANIHLGALAASAQPNPSEGLAPSPVNAVSLLGGATKPAPSNVSAPAAAPTQSDAQSIPKSIIDLGRFIYHGDTIEILTAAPPECVHHIFSDPPYAIDMANLQQENGGMNVTSTAEEHDKFDNIELLKRFIPLAFKVIKPRGWCVLFCDYEHWHWLRDDMEAVGFVVQRWPNHWIKQTGKNQAAGFNFTKASECILVGRKEGATLAEHQPRNWHMIEETDADRKQPHPFAKPRAICSAYIKAISAPSDIILDPFAGGGSIPAACIAEGRQFRAIEKKQSHFADMLTACGRGLASHFAGSELELVYNRHTPFER